VKERYYDRRFTERNTDMGIDGGRDSNREVGSAGVFPSYELFVAELCEESDRAMRSMTPSEKRFFETPLRENYVKPNDRGEDGGGPSWL
jgi:hypothetical protein